MHKIVTIFLFMLKYAWVLIDLRLGLRMDFFVLSHSSLTMMKLTN